MPEDKASLALAIGSRRGKSRPPFECIALLFQGGGALGAYQAGVYQALAEAGLHPDWVAGISIGAINAAIIAGNPPSERVDKLRDFWSSVSANGPLGRLFEFDTYVTRGYAVRRAFNQASAARTFFYGAAKFFLPRVPPPWLRADGCIEATSYYDTTALKRTLRRVIDLDRLNAGQIRFSVGAVNVRSGNFIYFDTTTDQIGFEHILASGAMPPAFPPIEIEGEHYWDGGLISNTPLQWVLQYKPRLDTLAFQVDLWSARGRFPRNIAEVATRQKEIVHSSRTRENTDRFTEQQRVRHAAAALLAKLPEHLTTGAEFDVLSGFADHKVYNIVHLIYRPKQYEGYSKDYDFSRLSMKDHWQAGYYDTVRALRHPECLERPAGVDGISIFDFANG